MLLGAQGLLGRSTGLQPAPEPTAHLSGNSTKKAAFRKRPKLQSAATSQWEWKPGSVLTTHLRTSVWRQEGTVREQSTLHGTSANSHEGCLRPSGKVCGLLWTMGRKGGARGGQRPADGTLPSRGLHHHPQARCQLPTRPPAYGPQGHKHPRILLPWHDGAWGTRRPPVQLHSPSDRMGTELSRS